VFVHAGILVLLELFLQAENLLLDLADSSLPVGDESFSWVQRIQFLLNLGAVLHDHSPMAFDFLADLPASAHAARVLQQCYAPRPCVTIAVL
jgi:hypothetical protein